MVWVNLKSYKNKQLFCDIKQKTTWSESRLHEIKYQVIFEIDLPQVPVAASREDISSNDLSNPQALVKQHATLMPDIRCSKYADMLNNDLTFIFQNPSCAIIVWIPGRSRNIFNYQSLINKTIWTPPVHQIVASVVTQWLAYLYPKQNRLEQKHTIHRYPKWDGTSLLTDPCCWIVGALGTQAVDLLSEAEFLLATSQSYPVKQSQEACQGCRTWSFHWVFFR